MTQFISGPGNPLPVPQFLYPSELYNAPPDAGTNYIALNGGDVWVIPAGRWLISPGEFGFIQYLDPVTGIWRGHEARRSQPQVVLSDGFTRRVANLTGCPVAAIVTAGGHGWAQASAVVTASAGSSTWQPIVGGALSITSVTAAGSGFTMPPICIIPSPVPASSSNAPATGVTNTANAPLGGFGGVQATAYATISSGTVSAVSLSNVGAGYLSAPSITMIANPSDPNYANITAATATCALASVSAITAVLCTNPAGPLASISTFSLTASGGSGTGATVVPVVCQTVTGTSITTGGVGLGNTTDPVYVTTVGGNAGTVSPTVIANPAIGLEAAVMRPALMAGVCNSGGTITSLTTYDSGLFFGTPSLAQAPGGASTSGVTFAQIAVTTTGSTIAVVSAQPL